MSELTPLSGQSNYDLTLQSYGTMDYFVKLISDNSTQSSIAKTTKYIFNPLLKNINSNIIGTKYATDYNKNTSSVYIDAYSDAYS